MRDWYSVVNKNRETQIDIRQDLISHLQSNYSPFYVNQDRLESSQPTVYPSKIGAFDFFDPTEGAINLVVMRDSESGALFAIEKEFIEQANNLKGECKIVSPYSPGNVLQIHK